MIAQNIQPADVANRWVMSNADIDLAVLAVTHSSWRKVAMIVAQAAHQVGGEFAARKDAYFLIASRLRVLVADGRLVAQGELTKWRDSEVRLP